MCRQIGPLEILFKMRCFNVVWCILCTILLWYILQVRFRCVSLQLKSHSLVSSPTRNCDNVGHTIKRDMIWEPFLKLFHEWFNTAINRGDTFNGMKNVRKTRTISTNWKAGENSVDEDKGYKMWYTVKASWSSVARDGQTKLRSPPVNFRIISHLWWGTCLMIIHDPMELRTCFRLKDSFVLKQPFSFWVYRIDWPEPKATIRKHFELYNKIDVFSYFCIFEKMKSYNYKLSSVYVVVNRILCRVSGLILEAVSTKVASTLSSFLQIGRIHLSCFLKLVCLCHWKET